MGGTTDPSSRPTPAEERPVKEDVYFIELSNRVLSVRMRPNTPGWRRRTLTFRVESGGLLSVREYRRVRALVVTELEKCGCVVRRIRAGREGP